jgi:hypothetical protein
LQLKLITSLIILNTLFTLKNNILKATKLPSKLGDVAAKREIQVLVFGANAPRRSKLRQRQV